MMATVFPSHQIIVITVEAEVLPIWDSERFNYQGFLRYKGTLISHTPPARTKRAAEAHLRKALREMDAQGI